MGWQKFYGRKPSQEWRSQHPYLYGHHSAFMQMKFDLISFHKRFDRELPLTKIEGLREMQKKTYHFRNRISLSIRRGKFESNRRLLRFFKRPCYVCRNKSECRHHIVSLKQGGWQSAKRNIVALCNQCHAKIHPWLAKAPQDHLTEEYKSVVGL